MKDFLYANMDRVIIIALFLSTVGMWFFRDGQFTQQCVHDVIIAILAFITGKKYSNGNGNGNGKS